MGRQLEGWAQEVLGPVRVLGQVDRRGVGLCELQDDDGRRWFVKQAGSERVWQREVRAYRAAGPALDGWVPLLRAAEQRHRMLLVSALPGAHPDRHDPRAHREAGRVLRRLHDANPPRPADRTLVELSTERLEGVLSRLPGLLSREEAAFARRQVSKLRRLPTPPQVLCHGDYKPHNWLMDGEGVLRVIDFGGSRWHVPAYDMTRLYLGPWWGHPELADAFFEGYGRRLDRHERQFVRRYAAVTAAVDIWHSHVHGETRREEAARRRLRQFIAASRRVRHLPCRVVGRAVLAARGG